MISISSADATLSRVDVILELVYVFKGDMYLPRVQEYGIMKYNFWWDSQDRNWCIIYFLVYSQ